MKILKKSIDHLPSALIAHGIFSAGHEAIKHYQNRNLEKNNEKIKEEKENILVHKPG